MKKILAFLIALALILPPEIAFAAKALKCFLFHWVCTSEMTPNPEALEGLKDLVQILTQTGVNTNRLEEAVELHQIHQEGAQAGGIFVSSDLTASEFSPDPQKPHYPYKSGSSRINNFIVAVDDLYTHAVHREDVISDLINKEFFNSSIRLKDTAHTAIHELIHAMIFRTQCFHGKAAKEEEMLNGEEKPNPRFPETGQGLETDIADRVTISLYSQTGNLDRATERYEQLKAAIEVKLQRKPTWRGCYETLGLPGLPPVIGNVTFQGLGVDFFPTGISRDGSVIIGFDFPTSFHALRWTQETGVELLLEPPGTIFTEPFAASADGSIIAGITDLPGGVFTWMESTNMMTGFNNLPPGTQVQSVSGISADGALVVGTGISPGSSEAFRWTQSGYVGLGFLGTFPVSGASDVSADGSIVVGNSAVAPNAGRVPFRWTANSGMVGLGHPAGSSFDSFARKISADGSVIAGESLFGIVWSLFRWTQNGGMVNLGNLPGGGQVGVSGISADGSLIVGTDHFPGFNEAFVWDATNGIRKLQDVLANIHGISLTGWKLDQVAGISSDGGTIIGRGINPNGENELWMISNFKPD